MTNRDAPLTFFGTGLPAGSLVFLKSRLRLYSVSAITANLTRIAEMTRVHLQPARRSRPTRQCRQSETAVETLRFARQRLADQVPNETTNHDVLAQFCNLRIQQVANCYIGIFDEALLQQANCAVEFL